MRSGAGNLWINRCRGVILVVNKLLLNLHMAIDQLGEETYVKATSVKPSQPNVQKP